jgi:rod shape determining protein RodA
MLNSALPDRLRALPWGVLLTLAALGMFGLAVLFSAAGGSLEPWALNQGIRFAMFFAMTLVMSQIPIDFWLRWAYPAYAAVLLMLMGVEAIGAVGGGSQRWLDLGPVQLQPSELMKIAIVTALARYFHFLPRVEAQNFRSLVPPALMIGMPMGLVMLQPDLGTALAITFGGVVIVFLAGARLSLFVGGGAALAAAIPIAIGFLHDYQRKRILIFLNPEADPLGAGYHITQSKIAIGSGGLSGKGFLSGTQSHLQYLPELHTDFIFATMAEEWGLAGMLFVLGCYAVILGWGLSVALRARTQFGRLTALGLTCTLFFYVFINMSMVMGFAPVDGIPLPLMSYGGSAMMTAMILIGMLLSIDRQRDLRMLGEGPSSL